MNIIENSRFYISKRTYNRKINKMIKSSCRYQWTEFAKNSIKSGDMDVKFKYQISLKFIQSFRRNRLDSNNATSVY